MVDQSAQERSDKLLPGKSAAAVCDIRNPEKKDKRTPEDIAESCCFCVLEKNIFFSGETISPLIPAVSKKLMYLLQHALPRGNSSLSQGGRGAMRFIQRMSTEPVFTHSLINRPDRSETVCNESGGGDNIAQSRRLLNIPGDPGGDEYHRMSIIGKNPGRIIRTIRIPDRSICQ
jgi:hypothetical protein